MKKKKSLKNKDREEKLREIIKFFEKYGDKATKYAFGVKKNCGVFMEKEIQGIAKVK
ncbi:MAG: hypothetical protein ABIN20_01710 [candidate division WOR-3 bacterium]